MEKFHSVEVFSIQNLSCFEFIIVCDHLPTIPNFNSFVAN